MINNSQITKIIHYCWFGPNKMLVLEKKCVASWKEHLPDYEIIEWDESKVEIDHPFLLSAYVADYVRLQKLFQYGGVYLDTDMMLLKSLDSFLLSTAFFGAEDEKFISAGTIGCVKEHPFIKRCLSAYSAIEEPIDWFAIAIPKIITNTFQEQFSNFQRFNKIVETEAIAICPSHYLYSLPCDRRGDINSFSMYLVEDSYAIHLWNSSWLELNEFQHFRRGEYWNGLRKVIGKIYRERQVEFKYVRKKFISSQRIFFQWDMENLILYLFYLALILG